MLENLLEYVGRNQRVCPNPNRWSEFWSIILEEEKARDAENPGPPIILGGWWETPNMFKMIRFRDQIRFAETIGVIDKVDLFLRNLAEDDWFHLNQ